MGQKFETAFYAKPDLRNVRPPEESAKSEPATLDLESLVEQLQKSPELASALAALIAAVPIAGLRDYDTAALLRLGRTLRHYPDFPKGANVNFYEIIGPDHVYERTYERGVEDFTYACGTGTGSVVTVLTLLGKVSGKHVRVDMTGGTLYVDADRTAAGRVTDLYLTGPTNVVCKGEITDENLIL